MNVTDRTNQIKDRLKDYIWNELEQGASATDLETWRTFTTDDPNHRWGWGVPIAVNSDVTQLRSLSIPICPELIARQTAHLNDDDLDFYLSAVEWVLARLVAHTARGHGTEEVHTLMLHDLYAQDDAGDYELGAAITALDQVHSNAVSEGLA